MHSIDCGFADLEDECMHARRKSSDVRVRGKGGRGASGSEEGKAGDGMGAREVLKLGGG